MRRAKFEIQSSKFVVQRQHHHPMSANALPMSNRERRRVFIASVIIYMQLTMPSELFIRVVKGVGLVCVSLMLM